MCCSAAASPLGSEDFYLTNSREDTALARTAKQIAFPPALQAERLSMLLQPLATPNPPSHLTSMVLLEVLAAVAVGGLPGPDQLHDTVDASPSQQTCQK